MKLTLLIIFIAISILPSLLAYMKRGMVKETVVPEMEGEEDSSALTKRMPLRNPRMSNRSTLHTRRLRPKTERGGRLLVW